MRHLYGHYVTTVSPHHGAHQNQGKMTCKLYLRRQVSVKTRNSSGPPRVTCPWPRCPGEPLDAGCARGAGTGHGDLNRTLSPFSPSANTPRARPPSAFPGRGSLGSSPAPRVRQKQKTDRDRRRRSPARPGPLPGRVSPAPGRGTCSRARPRSQSVAPPARGAGLPARLPWLPFSLPSSLPQTRTHPRPRSHLTAAGQRCGGRTKRGSPRPPRSAQPCPR